MKRSRRCTARSLPPAAPAGSIGRLWLAVMLGALAAGCAHLPGGRPHYVMSVQPTHVCAGDSVHVRWDANRKPTLYLVAPFESPQPFGPNPPGRGGIPLGRHGARAFKVASSTRVLLFLSANPRDPHGEVQVEVLRGDPILFGGLVSDTTSARPTVVVHVGPDQYPRHASVQVVSNPMRYRLTVSSGARSVTLDPGASTEEFHDTPVIGDWSLTVDPGSEPPPTRALASFTLFCP